MIIQADNSGPSVTQEVSLAAIEAATKRYAAEREELGRLVRALNDQVEAIKAACLTGIKRAVARTADRHGELKGLVEQGRHLFIRPRTVTFHGVKVGIEKGKGRIGFDDEEKVIHLIRRNLPDQVDGLVATLEMVRKTALKGLTVADLKSIGCTVEDTEDQVVIRPADTEVEKVVRALLKNAEE